MGMLLKYRTKLKEGERSRKERAKELGEKRTVKVKVRLPAQKKK